MRIEKAIKTKQKLRLALTGASGSGKTYSALILAHELGKRVCVIDTENGSASLYSDKFPEYDTIVLEPPYSPARYIQAISLVASYDVIIIDSLTHEWNGKGGCLEMVDVLTKSPRYNAYTAWGPVTKEHNSLLEHILNSRAHIIATMRSKTKHELMQVNGKFTPVKKGMESIQRSETDYEFTLVFDLDQNHHFVCTKDRSAIFINNEIPEPLGKGVAAKLIEWLNSGAEALEVKENIEHDTKAETFLTHRSMIEEYSLLLSTATTLDELKSFWLSIPPEHRINPNLIMDKEQLKIEIPFREKANKIFSDYNSGQVNKENTISAWTMLVSYYNTLAFIMPQYVIDQMDILFIDTNNIGDKCQSGCSHCDDEEDKEPINLNQEENKDEHD
jgi:dephospho-CoA kinase